MSSIWSTMHAVKAENLQHRCAVYGLTKEAVEYLFNSFSKAVLVDVETLLKFLENEGADGALMLIGRVRGYQTLLRGNYATMARREYSSISYYYKTSVNGKGSV